MALKTCSKCEKAMEDINFYTYRNGEKTEMCKKCLTLHIDNFDPDTFLWLLEKMDVPYIEEEWNSLRDKAFAKDPYKMNGMSVFGKYLSKMKLQQWKKYTWADTEILKAEKAERLAAIGIDPETQQQKDEELKRQLENGLISESEYKTRTSAESQNQGLQMQTPANQVGDNNFYDESNFMSESELGDISNDLTQDDKIYLALKWGRLYKPNEWVQLEQLYTQFMDSFDIQGAARMDTLKKICKTSLKMDQAIDCGDIDGYQKLSRVYDTLMKSAKFTEAQRKEEKAGEFDCVGLIVNFAESKKGGGKIPRKKLDTPYDIVDESIIRLKDYYKTLFKNDPSLRQQIENYIKKREIIAEQRKDQEEAKAQGYDAYQITDEDLIELHEAEEYERQRDAAQLLMFVPEDEDEVEGKKK